MKIDIKNGGYNQHEKLLKKGIEKKIDVVYGDGGIQIELAVNCVLEKEESYLITEEGDSWKITGADEAGL